MTLKTNNRKYLVLRTDGCEKRGLDHSLTIFGNAIKEAVYLGRTLIINKFSMASRHNLGHPAEYLEYKRYINLNKTQIYKIKQDESLQQVNDLFHHIDAENFDLNKYHEKDILSINKDIRPITKEENNRYNVIIRRTTDSNYHKNYPDILLSFYPSDEVEHLTDVVLKSLGTSLVDVKKRSLIYQGTNFSANNLHAGKPNTPLYYAGLDARGNDMYNKSSYSRYWSTPRHLKHIINHSRSVLKGCKIYIMSDIQDRRYFDFLKKDYTIYQYFDFPELEALISENNDCKIDNAMLYSVEKNILQYAYIKIVRAKYNSEIRYINSSFNIPLLSISPKYLRRKDLRQKFLQTIKKISRIKSIKIFFRKIKK